MNESSLTISSKTFNCRGRLLCIEKPVVMGIVNITPDSFYVQSRCQNEKELLKMVEHMLLEGATIIDVGGQSTRPNAELISEEEELKRVINSVEIICKTFPEAFVSIDTFYAKVAREAVLAGAAMINDISGGAMDEAMWVTVADLQVPYILMHNKGTPQNRQQQSVYENITHDLLKYFLEKIDALKNLGVHDIIIDPGFGFAKTTAQNFHLLHELESLKVLQKPLLVGLSRKSMIWKTLQTTSEESLNGTSVLNTIALMKGASILRVHDVKTAVEAVNLIEQLH